MVGESTNAFVSSAKGAPSDFVRFPTHFAATRSLMAVSPLALLAFARFRISSRAGSAPWLLALLASFPSLTSLELESLTSADMVAPVLFKAHEDSARLQHTDLRKHTWTVKQKDDRAKDKRQSK